MTADYSIEIAEITLAIPMHLGVATHDNIREMFDLQVEKFRVEHGHAPDWRAPETIEDFDALMDTYIDAVPLYWIRSMAEITGDLRLQLAVGQLDAELSDVVDGWDDLDDYGRDRMDEYDIGLAAQIGMDVPY